MMTGSGNASASAVLCLALLAGLAVTAAAGEADDVDPVVRDVVRMLEAEVDAAVILRWLDQVETPPETISADDLILLNESEASTQVITTLQEIPVAPSRVRQVRTERISILTAPEDRLGH